MNMVACYIWQCFMVVRGEKHVHFSLFPACSDVHLEALCKMTLCLWGKNEDEDPLQEHCDVIEFLTFTQRWIPVGQSLVRLTQTMSCEIIWDSFEFLQEESIDIDRALCDMNSIGLSHDFSVSNFGSR